jgi:hypothetical protein
MPEFHEDLVFRLPLYSRAGLIGHARVLDDPFARTVLIRSRWNVNPDRYPVGRSGGQLVCLHKAVFAHYHKDAQNSVDVDHEDGDRWNAMPDNLRSSTRSNNIANSGKRITNRSGFKGVAWDDANKKWRASIQVNYKSINLGRYQTKEEAARAVNAAYRKHFPTVRIPNPEAEA